MESVSIAWVGVLLASVVGFAVNMLWFSTKGFFPAWYRSLGKPMPDGSDSSGMGVAFAAVTAALIAQAITLDWVLQAVRALYGDDITLLAGLGTGLVAGIAFAAATSLGHRVFSGQGFRVWLIEVGADVLVLALMGAVLSFWR
jgi:hypothetical protein